MHIDIERDKTNETPESRRHEHNHTMSLSTCFGSQMPSASFLKPLGVILKNHMLV
jgi:hypothetical protein